jgi:outer membrane lipoprotein carrier protein
MVKQISLVLMALVISLGVMAQSDKKAENILNSVTAKTKSYKTISISFTYTMENTKKKIKDSYSGTLLSKGDKYKLNISKQEVICDGKTVWTFLKDANEVQISEVEPNDDSFTPTKLLTNYTKDYKSKFIEEKGNTQVIELYPLKKGKSFTKVQLTVDKTKLQVMKFVIFDKNGSTFTYAISKFTPDLTIADKEFVFNKADHPGVEINDMR